MILETRVRPPFWYLFCICPLISPSVLSAQGQIDTQTPLPVQGQPLMIDEEPQVTLGVANGDPEQELYRVVTPFLLSDGRIVVPLSAASEIRVFSPEGHLLTTVGGFGEGPGEFRGLGSAWPRGDTIEAFDRRLMRITRFLSDGTVETVKLEQAGYRLDSAVPGILEEGWVLKGLTSFGDLQRDEVSASYFLRDGAFGGLIARTVGAHRDRNGPGGIRPLTPNAAFAVAGGALYLGETLTPSIRAVDRAGAVVKEITWEVDRPPPTDAFREATRLAIENADPAYRVRLRAELGAVPAPDQIPVFKTFMVDELGFVWVRSYEVSRDAAILGGLDPESRAGGVWWIFSPGGVRVESIEVPAKLELEFLTTDFIVGIRRDELGLEYVQVHRLHRRKTQG